MATAERSRQRRVRVLGGVVAIALFTVVALGGLAVLQQTRADDETRAAAAAQDRADQALLLRRAVDSEPRVGLLLALEAQRRDPGPESDDVLLAAIRRAGGGRLDASYPALASGRCAAESGSVVSRDGLTESSTVGGMLVTRDLGTGATREHGPIPTEGCVRWFGDEATGRRYAYDTDPGIAPVASLWLGPLDGPWEVQVNRDWSSRVPGPHAFGPTRLLLETPGSVSLVDSLAGRLVTPPLYGLADEPLAQLSPDEQRFVVVASDPDGNGEIVIVHDARDGSELVRATIPSNVTTLAFDDAASQLLVATADNRLRTIDLDIGVVIADVPIDGSIEGAGSIGVTTDGLVTLISSGTDGLVRIIDRFSGQTRGPDLELAETSGGRIQPDDTIVTWGSGLELDIIDPRSEPLVEQTVDLTIDDARLGDNEQRVIVNGRHATIPLYRDSGHAAVFDLIDGEGGLVSLRTPDGRRFPEVRTQPMGDGLVAVTEDQRVGLWIDDLQVDEVVLESERRGWLLGVRSNDPFFLVALANQPWTIEDFHMLDVSDGRIERRFTVSGPPAVWAWPMSDGGLWRVTRDGRSERWDADGNLLAERSFKIADAGLVKTFAADERGRVAYVQADAPGGLSRIAIRDLEQGETIERTAPGLVNSMGFARGGDLLALQMVDGSVRVMDVDSGVTSGVLWDGDGTQLRTPWYDEATDAIWVASRERLVRLPIDPDAWREHACASVTGELTATEWDELVPGGEPQVPSCPPGG